MADRSPPDPRVCVLIIEDNVDAADTLARNLYRRAGFDVRVAYDGMAGLKSAVEQPPDAVVCDIGLPKIDGFQLARDLIAALPKAAPDRTHRLRSQLCGGTGA